MKTSALLRFVRLTAAVIIAVAAATPGSAVAQDEPPAQTEYTVRSGDTLFSLSRRFEITVEALRRANGLTGDRIRVGQRLVIPPVTGDLEPIPFPEADAPDYAAEGRADTAEVARVEIEVDTVDISADAPSELADSTVATVGDSPAADSAVVEVELGFLEVNPGRSLYEVAFATGLPVDSLRALNPRLAGFFADSTRLVVPAAYASVDYEVKPGDTLFKIAREFGTSVASIRIANSLPGDLIHVGQRLNVPSTRVAATPSEPSLPLVGEGEARVYPDRFAGRLTAGGRPYDPNEFTVSHRDLPIGSIVLLIRPDEGTKTFAEVTDRLPGSAEYLLDASNAVMRALDAGEGNIDVEVRVVRFGKYKN